jgi:hypothetical protein
MQHFPHGSFEKKIEAKYLLFALPSLWTINLAAVIMNDGT